MNNYSYRFIIALYGNRHRGTLLPLLYSIRTSNPDAGITLAWEEIDESFMDIIRKSFPEVELLKTDFHFGTDITKRISSKTLMWEYTVKKRTDEKLALIDADVIVAKNISSFFTGYKADIIYTVDHNNRYPINTGVILCHSTEEVQSFFSDWRKETQYIFQDPELYKMANNKKLIYGGTDQMAIQRLIKFKKGKNKYNYGKLVIAGVPRNQLNETNSVPIAKDTYIIHYKGGWNDILFYGRNFTLNRPKIASWEMYIYYLKTYRDSINYINKKTGHHFSPENFGLAIPFYLNRKTFQESKGLYIFYYIYAWIKAFPFRINRYFNERLKPRLSWR